MAGEAGSHYGELQRGRERSLRGRQGRGPPWPPSGSGCNVGARAEVDTDLTLFVVNTTGGDLTTGGISQDISSFPLKIGSFPGKGFTVPALPTENDRSGYLQPGPWFAPVATETLLGQAAELQAEVSQAEQQEGQLVEGTATEQSKQKVGQDRARGEGRG